MTIVLEIKAQMWRRKIQNFKVVKICYYQETNRTGI